MSKTLEQNFMPEKVDITLKTTGERERIRN